MPWYAHHFFNGASVREITIRNVYVWQAPPPLPPQAEVPVAPCADTNYNMPESKVMQNPNVMKHKFIPKADNPAELKLRKILDKKNAR